MNKKSKIIGEVKVKCSNCGYYGSPKRWAARYIIGVITLLSFFILGIIYFFTTKPYICPNCRQRDNLTKIFNDQDEYPIKAWDKSTFIIVWLFVSALITYSLVSSTISNIYNNNTSTMVTAPPKISVGSSDDVITINGFNYYYDKKYNFKILLPEEPEITDLDLEGTPIRNLRAVKYLNEDNFIQYSLGYTDTDIYSDSSINVYLNGYIKSKISSMTNSEHILKENELLFNNFAAKEYILEFTYNGVNMKMKGLVFIVNGDPIDISIIYPSSVNYEDTYFEKYIKSFYIK